jgi:hypothetical protein
MFSSTITNARPCPYPKPDRSSPFPTSYFVEIYLNIILHLGNCLMYFDEILHEGFYTKIWLINLTLFRIIVPQKNDTALVSNFSFLDVMLV